MTTAKITEKIKKLLALAKSPNEAEAMAAMDKAQELMATHGIDVSEVDTPDEEKGGVTDELITDGNRAVTWQGWILVALAKANHCRPYKSGGKFHLMGKPHHIEVVKSLFDYLVKTVERTAKDEMAKARRDPQAQPNQNPGYSWRKWGTDFRQGMANRIAERITEKRKNLEAYGTAEVAGLAIRNQALASRRDIEAFMRDQGLKLRSGSSARVRSGSDAWGSGQSAGSNVGLNSQMRGGSSRSARALTGR